MTNVQNSAILKAILPLIKHNDSSSSSESDDSCEELLITVAATLNRLSENLTLDYTTESFLVLYRIHPKLFLKLATKYEDSSFYRSQPAQGGGRPTIPPEKQVLIFLWYAGQRQASSRSMSEHFDVTTDSCCSILRRITGFLGKMYQDVITWPTLEQQKMSSRIYCQRSGIPNIIGSVDSFHVGIPTPRDNPQKYKNGNNAASVQVQVICDHSLKFLDVCVGIPGSLDASEVLQSSKIFSKLPELCKGKSLVGNSNYQISSWLLVPFRQAELNVAQENFNACLENVLLDARESLNQLKERFPCLYHFRLRQLKVVCEIIMGCCILHNMADTMDLAQIRGGDARHQSHEQEYIRTTPSGTDIRDSLAVQLLEDHPSFECDSYF